MAQARLKTQYLEQIRPALMERFGYSTPMQAPRISKVTVNMGVGDAKQDSKVLEAATDQLATITGQQPERAPRPQVDRPVQGARGDARGRRGDAAPRALATSSSTA